MQKQHIFIGRRAELARLNGLLSMRSASLVVVRGRRRIGKSRLLKEFGKQMKSFFFSGLPPKNKTKVTDAAQKKEFVNQLTQQGIPGRLPDDWSNLFWHLGQHTKEGRVLIVLDEISWMGSKDSNFLGKLKNAWDLYFSNNPQLILVVCGSMSAWIEKNILSNTGYLGRVSSDLTLEELPLKDAAAFWEPNAERISPYEKFKMLSVTGGVPLYLEQIRPELSAEENLRDICFTKGGLLVREFKQIFSDLFNRKSQSYQEIVECLADGPKDIPQICKELNKKRGGLYSEHMHNLVESGYVKRDFTWHLDTEDASKLTKYRLSDNYLRFYLKYIRPNALQIQNGLFSLPSLTALPAWESIMGLQFENLVVHNRKVLWKLLGIDPSDIIMDGPYFQTKTAERPGCQIDYLLHTRFQCIYLVEIKFSKKPITLSIIEEVEKKRTSLSIPKHCSLRPILVHVNGVDESLQDARYFDKTIDFGQLLVE